jgi:hypothetical protein
VAATWLRRGAALGVSRWLRRKPWQRIPDDLRAVRERLRYKRELDHTRTRQQRLEARSRRLEVAGAAGALLLCLLVGAIAPTPGVSAREAQAAAALPAGAADVTGTGGTATAGTDGESLARSAPTRVRVPGAGIDVEVFGADLDPDGGPPTPAEQDAMRAAWYQGGVSPGETGAALIVGHLDTMVGPAAFAGLGILKPGGTIEVDREDGTTAVFTVEAVEQYPKQDFPDERVYGSVDTPQLRLITCGGRWSSTNGYDANIVAYARLGDGSGPAAAGQPEAEADPVPEAAAVPEPAPDGSGWFPGVPRPPRLPELDRFRQPAAPVEPAEPAVPETYQEPAHPEPYDDGYDQYDEGDQYDGRYDEYDAPAPDNGTFGGPDDPGAFGSVFEDSLGGSSPTPGAFSRRPARP